MAHGRGHGGRVLGRQGGDLSALLQLYVEYRRVVWVLVSLLWQGMLREGGLFLLLSQWVLRLVCQPKRKFSGAGQLAGEVGGGLHRGCQPQGRPEPVEEGPARS